MVAGHASPWKRVLASSRSHAHRAYLQISDAERAAADAMSPVAHVTQVRYRISGTKPGARQLAGCAGAQRPARAQGCTRLARA